MGTRRFFLILAIALVSLMLWQEWQLDYGRPAAPSPAAAFPPVAVPGDTAPQPAVPGDTAPADMTPGDRVPGDRAPGDDVPDLRPPEAPGEELAAPVAPPMPQTGYIRVETDVLQLDIDPRGGTLVGLALKRYPVEKRVPDVPVRLLRRSPRDFYIVQTGLLARQAPAPSHEALYRSDSTDYRLGNAESLAVDLHWQSGTGLAVTKTLLFRRASYAVEVIHRVDNRSDEDWRGNVYGQLQRTPPGKRESYFIYTYTGAVLSTPEDRYRKIDFSDIRKGIAPVDAEAAWAALIQHYFVTALVPANRREVWRYYTRSAPSTGGHIIGALSGGHRVGTGESKELGQVLYLGPKLQRELRSVADGLELTVDYGFLWFIGKVLFWLLEVFYRLTGNWGAAIVLLTVFVKLLFYRLSASGYRSMAELRRLQPRMQALRERHGADRQQMNQAMMKLYKEEKVNPLGGCFPILVQIPVFIALYWVLLESVEIRQAEFVFWIDDLSSPDRFFVLPILMGLTMYAQQKMNPPPMDPMQEKILSVMPLVFSVFSAFFPSGLVLYWVASNILSIAQQWKITRDLERPKAVTRSA